MTGRTDHRTVALPGRLALVVLAALSVPLLAMAAAVPAVAVDRTELLRALDDAAFSYLPGSEEARLLKWEGEVRIAGLGTPSVTMTQAVEALSRGIKTVTSLPMGYTEQEVNLLFAFSNRPEEDLRGRWERWAAPFFESDAEFHQAAASLEQDGAPPCFGKAVILENAIRGALIVIHTDAAEDLAVQCLTHAYLAALGIVRTGRLPSDSLLRQASAAFAPGEPVELSESDRALLWLLYHRDMPHGIGREDGLEIGEMLLEAMPGLD